MPPVTDTVAVPSLKLLQLTFVLAVIEAEITFGSVIITVAVAIHPFASVTTTVCVPAPSIVAVGVASLLLQLYV